MPFECGQLLSGLRVTQLDGLLPNSLICASCWAGEKATGKTYIRAGASTFFQFPQLFFLHRSHLSTKLSSFMRNRGKKLSRSAFGDPRALRASAGLSYLLSGLRADGVESFPAACDAAIRENGFTVADYK